MKEFKFYKFKDDIFNDGDILSNHWSNVLTSAKRFDQCWSRKRLKQTWWLVPHRAITLRLRKRGFREGATPARRAVEARTRWLGTVTTVTQPAPSWPAVTAGAGRPSLCRQAESLPLASLESLAHETLACATEGRSLCAARVTKSAWAAFCFSTGQIV